MRNFCLFSIFIRLYNTAIRLGELQVQCNVSIDPEEYAQVNLKFGLVEVVYEWAKVTIICRQMVFPYCTHNKYANFYCLNMWITGNTIC